MINNLPLTFADIGANRMFPGLRMPKGAFLREAFMKNYEFWFIVGSQTLYGPEVLETVDARAREMAAYLTERLPYPLVYKGTPSIMVDSEYSPSEIRSPVPVGP